MPSRTAVAFVLCLATGAAARAQQEVGRADIERAMRLARASEGERARFHEPYQVPVTGELVERLEVITEYRRMVLITEERFASGDWAFTTDARAGEEALRPWKQKVTIRIRIRFRPTDLYTTGMPLVSVVLGRSPAQVLPTSVTTEPQYALRGDPNEKFTPIVGMVVEAIFDAAAVGARAQPILVSGPGTLELRRTVDFARLR